jgi:type II restriction enzyme
VPEGYNWSKATEAVWQCILLMDVDVDSTFTLKEIYSAEPVLQLIYPRNTRIRAKIRQQLQVIRDHGRLQFVDNDGVYRRLK